MPAGLCFRLLDYQAQLESGAVVLSQEIQRGRLLPFTVFASSNSFQATDDKKLIRFVCEN